MPVRASGSRIASAILACLGLACHTPHGDPVLSAAEWPLRFDPALPTLVDASAFELRLAPAPPPEAVDEPPPIYAAVLDTAAPGLDRLECERLAEALHELQGHGHDPWLLLSVMAQESRFDPDAIGPRGSVGLMQIRPFVGEDVARRHGLDWEGDQTLRDPVANLWIGATYLAEMMEMYADPELALVAYNMGPYRLRQILARGGQPGRRYVEDVLDHYEQLRDSSDTP